jgi:hypothetical protein
MMSRDRTCLVYDTPCVKHGFFHGAEANELREGIERLLARESTGKELRRDLQELLDRVDARDSLARLEAQDPNHR